MSIKSSASFALRFRTLYGRSPLRYSSERWDDLVTARLAHIATLYSPWSAL